MNTENTYNVDEKVEEFKKAFWKLSGQGPGELDKKQDECIRTALQSAHAEGVKAGRESVVTKIDELLSYPLIHRDMHEALSVIKSKLTPDNNT